MIVDDEELARGLLREMLKAHPEIEIAAECANGFEAVKAIGETSPDLVFLDVQMPKLDGFEVLELIDPGPAIIFVTAYDQYAMRAFDAQAVDYLLKPFSARAFRAGAGTGQVARWRARQPRAELAAARPRARAAGTDRGQGWRPRCTSSRSRSWITWKRRTITWRCTSGGKSYLKQQPIAGLEAVLDPARFVRIHRSAIVNLERVARIEPYAKDSRIAILADGTRLPVSRSGYARLMEAMGDSQGNRKSTR